MTDRLYFTDSYLTEFDSRVSSCALVEGRFEVVLDATAFYPTGGGQPHDRGTLGGHAVQDVIERDDRILHLLDGPVEPDTPVKGQVDWMRRFDHMQQHSGQHILSAAFVCAAQARTESFHLGVKTCTIDLHRDVSTAEIAAAEAEANRIVWEDREVRLRFTSAEESGNLALRKETTREGTLRLIEVPDFDLSACGGTHVARTGAVGVIAVTGWEKFKGGARIEFVCGGRALGRLREWRDVFSATKRVLSVAPEALASSIERLQAENKTLGKENRDLRERLAVYRAHELVAANRREPGERVMVVERIEGSDAADLRTIATAAAAEQGVCAVLFSASIPALVVVAAHPEARIDAAVLIKALFTQFGGKGGGKSGFAQGGGLTGEGDALLAAARELAGI